LISETVHQQLWLFWLLIIVAGRHLVMRANRGSSLPKKGKALHRTDRESGSSADYAAAIAEALRHDLGKTHRAVKSVMRWTGASERTVKYWLAGAGGPSGEHLIALARHSDTVLQMILRLADHRRFEAALRLIQAREMLSEMVDAIQQIIDDLSPDK
jgi:hypothetical protein